MTKGITEFAQVLSANGTIYVIHLATGEIKTMPINDYIDARESEGLTNTIVFWRESSAAIAAEKVKRRLSLAS